MTKIKAHSSGITKEEFETYEAIRKSGTTNMFDVGVVEMLSGYTLDGKKILTIMKNYDNLCDFYPRREAT